MAYVAFRTFMQKDPIILFKVVMKGNRHVERPVSVRF